MGVGVINFSGEKHYEGVRFNVISVTRRWVGVQLPEKKRYVTLQWPLMHLFSAHMSIYTLVFVTSLQVNTSNSLKHVCFIQLFKMVCCNNDDVVFIRLMIPFYSAMHVLIAKQ